MPCIRSIVKTARAPVPEHLGHAKQIAFGKVAAQLAGVGGLDHQVEFVMQVLVELGHHLAGLEAPAVHPDALEPRGHVAHQRQIAVDYRQHARTQHLHGHLAAMARTAAQRGEVHLGDRRAGHRLVLERLEQLVSRRPSDFR
jgi:hypothetical protein